MDMTPGGNIGIATTATTERLTVAGNIVPSVSDTYTLGTADNVWKDVYVGNNSLHIEDVKLSNTNGSLSWGDQPISVWSPVTGGINYSAGNVGIGHNPGYNKFRITNTIGSNNMSAKQHETQIAIFGPGNKSMAVGVMDDGKGMIQVKEDGVGYNSLCLNPVAGNVGVGTDNPGYNKFRITNTIGSNDMSAKQHETQMAIFGPGNRSMAVGVMDDGKGMIQVKESGVGYNSLCLNPVAGNVGIGTTLPRTRLDVVGSGGTSLWW